MKKIISTFLAVIISITLVTTCFAEDSSDIAWEFDDISTTVIFDGETAYSESEQQYIAEMLVYGSSDVTFVQPRAWCWLTGHDKTTEYVNVITHKAYATAPRCIKEQYKVVTCSKCDFEEMTLISTTSISCCPVD